MTSELYDRTFHLGAERSAEESAPLVIPLIVKYLGYMPKRVIDIGCSTGWWLRTFLDHGATHVRGVDFGVDRDLLHIPTECYIDVDLRTILPDIEPPGAARRFYDLAVSLEVGEHLPLELSDALVRYMTGLAPAVFFGAAHPGQGGVDHIAEQPISAWIDRFAWNGYEPIDFRDELRADPRIAGHYKNNPLLYLRRS